MAQMVRIGKDGEKGEKGDPGQNGKDGADGKDGKDGENGKDGINGQDGYTPVRGVDYWTNADKTEIVNDVLSQIQDSEEVEY